MGLFLVTRKLFTSVSYTGRKSWFRQSPFIYVSVQGRINLLFVLTRFTHVNTFWLKIFFIYHKCLPISCGKRLYFFISIWLFMYSKVWIFMFNGDRNYFLCYDDNYNEYVQKYIKCWHARIWPPLKRITLKVLWRLTKSL